MKRRLLSLLLVMAMLLSMVPFQAFAEEVDEAPTLLEETEEIVSEIPEETVPETTEETVPETTEETVPETTEETVPETTEETVPEIIEETVPETVEETVPETTEEIILEEEPVLLLDEPDEETPVAGEQTITVENPEVSLRAGAVFQLKATGAGGENEYIKWSVVTAKAPVKLTAGGLLTVNSKISKVTTITVKAESTVDGYDPATAEVTLYPALKLVVDAPASFNILGEGDSFTLTAEARDGGPIGSGVTWTVTKNASLASVDEDGVVTIKDKTKTGTITVTATSKDNAKVKASATIKLVKAPYKAFAINPLPSYAQTGDNYLRSGTKVTLTTEITKSKEYTDKTLTWEVISDAETDFLASFVKIDSKKGVLSVDKNLPEPFTFTVKASSPVLNSDNGYGELVVTALPPVNSFKVDVRDYYPDEETPSSAINRVDKTPVERTLDAGAFVLVAYEFAPDYDGYYVNWDTPKVTPKSAATVGKDENGNPTIDPKLPCKVTFTATAADGSGAKFSGTVIVTGTAAKTEIVKPSTTTLTAGKSLTLKANAWYDVDEQGKGVDLIASPKIDWDVKEKDGEDYKDTTLASISAKGVLTTSKALSKTTTFAVTATVNDATSDPVEITVKPIYEETLVLATFDGELTGETSLTELTKDQLVALYDRRTEPSVNIVAALKDNAGDLHLPALTDSVGTTITASNKKAVATYENGVLTFADMDNIKYTITATYGKQKVTAVYTADTSADKVQIEQGAAAAVDPGKTLKLNAVSTYTVGEETRQTTVQKFTWAITDSTVPENVKGLKLSSSGVLTAPKLDRAATVTVTVTDYYGNKADITVTINPVKQTKISASLAEDVLTDGVFVLKDQDTPHVAKDSFVLNVLVNGEDKVVTVTDVTSKSKNVKRVTTDDVFSGIDFTAAGKVTLTVTGTYTDDTETKTVSANLTFNVVKAVTQIEIKAPTDVLFVGKSAKFTSAVNPDASNKKLVWNVANADGSELDANDKTTIKDGVLKVDTSWSNSGRGYLVWATAADGYGAESQKRPIFAYSLAASVKVSAESLDYGDVMDTVNNQVVTIRGSESVQFSAELLDADGKNTCLQGVKWTVSGNGKDYVAETRDDEEQTLTLTGLKPGTVTVTVASTNYSKAAASFTVKVVESTYEAVVGNVGYDDLQEAVDAADGQTVKLMKDVTIQGEYSLTVNEGTAVELNLNNHTITATRTAIANNGTLTVYGGSVVSNGQNAVEVGAGSVTTIKSGNFTSLQSAVATPATTTGATITIEGGTFKALDNAVISGNGSARDGEPNTFNIKGGTFIGGTQSKGYIACGIYCPWQDVFNVTGGTFKITGGAGVVARAGNVNISDGAVFNVTGTTKGRIGDSETVVPCSALVFDVESDYPALTKDSKITVSGGDFTYKGEFTTVVGESEIDRIVIEQGG